MRRIDLRKEDAADRCRKNCGNSEVYSPTFIHWGYLNRSKIGLMIMI